MKNRSALHFVLIIGIANFFADFTYEGARGIIGPFLGSLGASAAIVGFVAGLGELMGYGLRSISGYLADKSHRHWAFAFVGYAVNMFAVPALALTGRWPLDLGGVEIPGLGNLAGGCLALRSRGRTGRPPPVTIHLTGSRSVVVSSCCCSRSGTDVA